jgi:TonB family protein
MSFFADAHETTERFGKYIDEYRELFRKYDVSFGSQEDFFRLTPKLAYDDRFRVDFSELTKNIGQREEGRLTLTRVLTIAAIAIGGEQIEGLGSGSAVSVSLVVVFLAGVGGWSEREMDEAAPDFSPRALQEELVVSAREDTREDVPATVGRGETIEEREGEEFEQQLVSNGSGGDHEELMASQPGAPALMKETLSRLETNTLALKLHLESINSRMDKIEPRLASIPTRIYSGDGIATTRQHMDRVKVRLPVQRYPRLNEDTEIRVPPAAVPEDAAVNSLQLRRLRGLVVVLGALAFVLAVAMGLYLYFDHFRQGKTELNDKTGMGIESQKAVAMGNSSADLRSEHAVLTGNGLRPVSGEPPTTRAPSASSVPERSPAVEKESRESEVATVGSAPRKIAPMKVENSPPLVARTVDGMKMAGGVPSGIAAGAHPVVNVAEPPTATVPPPKVAQEKKPVFVPSGVLNSNVLLAPRPVYPSVARLEKVQGVVVVQAVISEKGKVESVSVVSGPVGLQQAAMDAMRSWKYRPYMVDGVPVQVRTFVSFNFVRDH